MYINFNVKYQVFSSSLSACLLFNAFFLLYNIAFICSARSFRYSWSIETLIYRPFYVVLTDFNLSLLFLIYYNRFVLAVCWSFVLDGWCWFFLIDCCWFVSWWDGGGGESFFESLGFMGCDY